MEKLQHMERYYEILHCMLLTIPDQYLDSIDIQSIDMDTVSDNKWQHIEKIDVIPRRKI